MARYIDADLFLKKLQSNMRDAYQKLVMAEPGSKERECLNAKLSGLWAAFFYIHATPTADVREAMASAWIPVSERLPDEEDLED